MSCCFTATQIAYADDLVQLDYKDVKPILDSRCVVCHACYDAPCQLKLTAVEGVKRGASKTPVYKRDRLLAADPTRLFIDAHSIGQWRELDFFPVVDESDKSTPTTNLLIKLLEQKKQHPMNQEPRLEKSFDLSLNREWQCTTLSDYDSYNKKYPKWGMPYALPALSDSEHSSLVKWVNEGSPSFHPITINSDNLAQIDKWEAFLNNDELKHQLTARYLYEHFFIAHLYFKQETQDTSPQFFRLFRSTTPPGQPIDIIKSRRPFSDPKVERVYYRFAIEKETIVDKTHMPYLLNDNRLAQFIKWFITPDYQITSLPSYDAKVAANPFVTFQDLPIDARYQFLITEAKYNISQFIKGPVCRGQIALNVINDHFWVFFASPSSTSLELQADFLSQTQKTLNMPAQAKSNALPIDWIKYAEHEKKYLKAKRDYIHKVVTDVTPLDLSLVWDGFSNNVYNDNAALTVFRHYDAATVVNGLVGGKPKTAWVLTYSLFERIHYLLVAGYDVYGNVGHQLNSRIYMDFLRMEGESNFLAFLPEQSRKETWSSWYRGALSPVADYISSSNLLIGKTDIDYKTNQPLDELYEKLKDHTAQAVSHSYDIDNGFTNKEVTQALNTLNAIVGRNASFLPQASFIRLFDNSTNTQHFYTLTRNNAYSNISHIFDEKSRRRPKEDTLSVGYGFLSSHPNAFFDIEVSELPQFVKAIQALQSLEDAESLSDTFGVRRKSDNFWRYADNLHNYYKAQSNTQFGLFDFNRLSLNDQVKIKDKVENNVENKDTSER